MKIFELFSSKQIKVAAIGGLSIKFFSAIFAFLSSVLLARILGTEHFGFYVLAFTTAVLMSVPVSLGFPLLITRYISKYEMSGNKGAMKGLLIRTNQTVLLTSVLILSLTYLSYLFWWRKIDPILVETLWYGFLLVPLIALGSLRAAALRGLRYIVLGQLPDTLLRNFLLCTGLGYYFLTETPLLPKEAMLIHVFAAAITYVIGYFFLYKKLLISIKSVNPIFHDKEWFKQSIPFSINSGVQVVKSKLVTYVLAVFGSIEAVAIFDVAIRGSTLVAFTLDGLNTAIAPYISNAFEKKQMENLQRIVTKSSRIIFLFAVPVVLIFVLGGELLLEFLYGTAYKIAYVPLVIVCLGQLINAAAGSVGLVMNMTGRQAYYTKVTFFVTLLSIILSIPFVIYYDVIGAAIVYSLLLILQNIILVKYVKTKLKVNTTVL